MDVSVNGARSGFNGSDSQHNKGGNSHGGEERSWARLVKENRFTKKGIPLQAVQKRSSEARMVAVEPDPVHNIWGYCAMGYFPGRFLGKEAVHKLTQTWKVPSQFHFHASDGLYSGLRMNKTEIKSLPRPLHYVW